MDAKLNQSDLISLLAKGCNISVAKAEQFTKNFFDLIVEGLEQDGIVKINGLGTFKITDVASRGSVNVNTGEKIEIKGHKKLTFIPADALKDNVNQPFAMFEPVEVDDTYQPDSANESEADETIEVDGVAEEVIEDVPTIAEPQNATSHSDGMDPLVEEKETFADGDDAEEKNRK
jgi:nucleoid DNA-binding protein